MPPASRGRPAGSTSKPWADAIRKAVNEIDKDTRVKRLQLLAMRLVHNGLGGDASALKEIGDRLDGKAVQQIDAVITDERMVVEATQPSETAKDWQAKHGLH